MISMTALEHPPSGPFTEHELAAWRGMLQVHARVTRQLDAQMRAEHGLSVSAYEVLMFLADAPDHRLRMSEIADRVLLSRSGLTRLVERLEREGLLERADCPSDARGSLAVLTDEGMSRLAQARKTHLRGVRERFHDHFSDDELEQLGEYWRRVLGPEGQPEG
jgi:DNA-binding MarR family transcriptional regulator